MDHVPASESASAPAWHAMPCPQVIDRLHSDGVRGLGQAAAAARLAAGGRNRLPAPPPDTPVVVLLRQLRSPLVYVLLLAAGLALLLGHATDAGFIGVVLLVNSLLGAWQELQAGRQSANLQGLLRVRATVQRDGRARQVDAEELVAGDVVLLESGDRVPADLRLLEARGLEVDASLLTGESLPVLCDAGALCAEEVAPPDRVNCAHAGTLVVHGRGRGIVIATGLQTEVGRLARAMIATVAGKPPLTARMEHFSRSIAWVVLFAAVLIGTIAVLLHDQPVFTMFTFGVALAVSAIPEGLPVAVTVALAIAARRMAQRGAIVRQLPAVEGLGSCSLIASDKTGTLTCNELTVVDLVLDDGSRWSASGAGYAPAGEIRVEAGAGPDSAARLRQVLRIAAACNEAEIFPQEGRWEYRGDPTDLALLALAGKGGVDRIALLGEWPCVDRLAYEPERRYAATFHRCAGGSWIAVKGAPERVFELCTLDAAVRARMQCEVTALAAAGKRVLALAEGQAGPARAPDGGPAEPSGLTLRGIAGLVDPLRPGAAAAVARCRAAGIRVAMITGDHPVTALAIARDLGIAQTAAEVVEGPTLAGLEAPALRAVVERATVFARVTPEQKLAIVAAAQSAGQFVAVTGDGVNDAPALRRANIGVAMGRGGTDVAREAADLVLSDDNFATIVAGVEEGRIAYRNIRSVVYLLTAAGIAEVLTVGIAVLAGLPLPLLPVQLLWLNLVTNGIQDVGLAFERGTGDELRSPPRSSREPIFDRVMLQRGVLAGLWMALLGLALFIALLGAGRPLEEARNALLLLMVLMQNVDAVNARSEILPALRLPWRNNPLLLAGIALALALHLTALHLPALQSVLAVMPPSLADWIILPGLALSLLVLMEGQKYWRRHRRAG